MGNQLLASSYWLRVHPSRDTIPAMRTCRRRTGRLAMDHAMDGAPGRFGEKGLYADGFAGLLRLDFGSGFERFDAEEDSGNEASKTRNREK